MEKYDLIIIGAGPAGLTAGIYAVRSGLKTAIISKDIGGTANKILMLENWPGFKGKGAKLMKQMYEHLNGYKEANIIIGEANVIEKKEKGFVVKTRKGSYESDTLIITTGTRRRTLNINGENKFIGKGVSYCATCDAIFFRNKTVAIIGGSDCAAISALALSDLAKKVYVFYRREKLNCEKITLERLKKRKNIEIIYNAIPKEILGKDSVESIKVDVKGKEEVVKLNGIFIEIGNIPMKEQANILGLKVNKKGYIIVNKKMESSIRGVYAAGDVTNFPLKQVIVASSQGAIAAKNVYEWISKNR
ncbi:MAG: FAD-dependent oxidoreductase [Nanoarchaeota archaeon]